SSNCSTSTVPLRLRCCRQRTRTQAPGLLEFAYGASFECSPSVRKLRRQGFDASALFLRYRGTFARVRRINRRLLARAAVTRRPVRGRQEVRRRLLRRDSLRRLLLFRLRLARRSGLEPVARCVLRRSDVV